MYNDVVQFLTDILSDGTATTAIATGIGGLTVGLSLKKKIKWGKLIAPLVKPISKAIRSIFKK